MSVETATPASPEHPVREELRRIASDAGYAMRLAAGRINLPPPTPSDGPDPYGNPDPEWMGIDWREHLPATAHDLPVDLVATPRAVIEVERQYPRPRGILWDHLQPPQIREIPILERMGYA